MTTKELTLPPDVAALLDARLASGPEESAADVLRAALAALEAEDARKLQDVREKLARSLADPRPSIPAEAAFDNIEKLLRVLEGLMPRVVFRPEANADLAAIALTIAQHSVKRAKSFVGRLRNRCNMLVEHPEAGRLRPELGENIRSLYERPYLLIYRLHKDTVEIVAVVHAMRDLPGALAARVSSNKD